MIPAIFAIKTYFLTDDEISLFKKHLPWGIILFERNVLNKKQVKNLTKQIKKISQEINILIDEEGGRITRLKKIFLEKLPTALVLGELYEKNKVLGKKKIIKTYQEIANRLKILGINIACSPVCDLQHKNTHQIIGDRAFSSNLETVISCAKIASDTFLKNDIIPVLKHIPGHGRADLDSHLDLPVIKDDLEVLEKSDFKIFKQLNNYPLAMTAHIIYNSLDKKMPITLSKKSISYIKDNLNYRGKIISDDINMKALQNYSIAEITKLTIASGVDFVLHCNGDINEMKEIADILTKQC